MNNDRIPIAGHVEIVFNAADRIRSMIKRIESGSIRPGDNLGLDDLEIVAFAGYPSGIVTDVDQLLSKLNDMLVYLTNND